LTEISRAGAAQLSLTGELWRKATHLAALAIPLGYYLLKLDQVTMSTIMGVLAICMFLIEVSRFRKWWIWRKLAGPLIRPMVRRREMKGDFTGATYILLSSCFTIAFYSKPIAAAALSFIIVGDILAALVGRMFGRHRIGKKTLEGSFGCLLGTLIVIPFLPDLTLEFPELLPGNVLTIWLIGAITATITEALPLGADDNISVPILSGLVMTLSINLFV
jgi:dolichol kinase